MNLLSRLRERVDAPRYCRWDGQAIRVHAVERFDPRSGEVRTVYAWSCPDVYLNIDADGWVPHAEQRGVDVIHPFGRGRPHWHKAATTPEPTP